jgi:hypothetical protein
VTAVSPSGVGPAGTQLPDHGPIEIVDDFLWHGGVGAGQACSVFHTNALVAYMQQNYPSYNCAIPVGRVVHGSDHVSTFSDTDGTQGVAVMRQPVAANDGYLTVLTCKPTGELTTSACQAISADFEARLPVSALPGSSTPPSPTGPAKYIVTRTGMIDSLKMGVSTAADVRAVFGTSGASATGNMGVGMSDFNSVGYDCTTNYADNVVPIHGATTVQEGPYCATVFYINSTKNTLAGFITSNKKFATEHGTTVGMTVAQATKNENRARVQGCDDSVPTGPTSSQRSILLQINTTTGRVSWLSVDWPANSVGVNFC